MSILTGEGWVMELLAGWPSKAHPLRVRGPPSHLFGINSGATATRL